VLYFIYGEDNFLSYNYLLKVIDFYKRKKPAFFSFDFSDKFSPAPDTKNLEEILKANNLFCGSKLIVIKNFIAETSSELQKVFLKILDRQNIDKAKDTMVVFYENQKVKNIFSKKWLTKKAKGVKEFNFLDKQALEQWIKKEEGKMGIKLAPDARQALMESFPFDSGSIYNILKKLSLIDKKGVYDRDFLEENVFLPAQNDIFEFLDSLAAKKAARAYWLLEKLIAQGHHPLYILKMIVFEIRNIIIVKEILEKKVGGSKSVSHFNPYVFKKLAVLAKEFKKESLKKIYFFLMKYDRRIKDGSIKSELALEMLLVDFLSQK
jgi:DNA polymerase III delta subunit